MIFPILRALMVGASIGLLVYATPAWAQTSVKVKFPWVRATVPAQQTTGAFMTLIARQDSRLVAVDSPIAGLIEIHQMRVEGDVMRMRRIDAIDLPAGQEVALKPGGYHLMLMQLSKPLSVGQTVALRLTIQSARNNREVIQVNAPVRAISAGHQKH